MTFGYIIFIRVLYFSSLKLFEIILMEIICKFSVTVSRTIKFAPIIKDKSVNNVYGNKRSVLRIRHKTQKRQGLT